MEIPIWECQLKYNNNNNILKDKTNEEVTF